MNEMGHALGYQTGDEFISIDGQMIPTTNIQQFIQEFMANLVVGDMLEVKVLRKDENGVGHEVVLQAKNRKVKRMSPPKLTVDTDANADQVALREAWLGTK